MGSRFQFRVGAAAVPTTSSDVTPLGLVRTICTMIRARYPRSIRRLEECPIRRIFARAARRLATASRVQSPSL
jgi:hypothetical protein